MWRYQTEERSAQKLWQADWQQDYAAMNGFGTNSPHKTPSAWESANATFKPAVIEPATARAQSSGTCWTQPYQNHWQRSSPISPFQSGVSSEWRSASAPASYSSQPAEARYTQHSLLDAQWKSLSNYRAACHRHISPQPQRLAHFNCAKSSCCDSRTLQGHQYQDSAQLQSCQPRSSFAAVRCLSGSQQLGLREKPQMSGTLPLVCSSAIKSEHCSETAACAATMWPNNSVCQDTLEDKVPNSRSTTQALVLSDSTHRGLPPRASTLDSSSESQCCKSEDDSTPDLTPVEQPTRANGRKKKAELDHITVEYLRNHHYFDMPLAEAAKSLDVGLSVMKRHCRDLGLARWPYRIRSSLRAVIEKTERYLMAVHIMHACIKSRADGHWSIVTFACIQADTQHQDQGGSLASGQKANVLQALQSHMKASTGQGGADLHDSIKKYRESIFKLNYKLKKTKQNHKARHKISVPLNAAEKVLADHNKISDAVQ